MLIDEFLSEGRNDYEAMFRGVLNDPEVDAEDKEWIRDRIKWARETLRKSDRIVWFLRYIKALVMDGHAETGTPGQDWVATFDPDCLVNKPNLNSFALQKTWNTLAHFMSLDCPEIQNMVFGKTPVRELMSKMRAAEAEWAADRKGKIPADHPNNAKAEIIVDFGNGWVWMNLHRPSCDQEGSAMGHCGNSPRRDSDDTVLSLRKRTQKGKSTLYEPHLTFTMDEEGYLSERKGRANEKPNPRYHEMIVALLELHEGDDWFIKGIGESHWERHKDFVIDDLAPELRAQLISVRPDFGNALEYWNGTGAGKMNPAVLSGKIMQRLNGKYQANVEIRCPQGKYEVRCHLVIPDLLQKLMRGEVVQDPYSINVTQRSSEAVRARRNRVRKLHDEEMLTILEDMIEESVSECKDRIADMERSLKPLFRIETKNTQRQVKAGIEARFENWNSGGVDCIAIAPLEEFLTALYASTHATGDIKGDRLLQLIDYEHVIERLQDMMNGKSLGRDARALERFAERMANNLRISVLRKIEEFEKIDIEQFGDVEGERGPADHLPVEDWEIEASTPSASRGRSTSIFDD